MGRERSVGRERARGWRGLQALICSPELFPRRLRVQLVQPRNFAGPNGTRHGREDSRPNASSRLARIPALIVRRCTCLASLFFQTSSKPACFHVSGCRPNALSRTCTCASASRRRPLLAVGAGRATHGTNRWLAQLSVALQEAHFAFAQAAWGCGGAHREAHECLGEPAAPLVLAALLFADGW